MGEQIFTNCKLIYIHYIQNRCIRSEDTLLQTNLKTIGWLYGTNKRKRVKNNIIINYNSLFANKLSYFIKRVKFALIR